MTQSPNTKSTFPHLSWQESELHFDNMLAVFLLMLMTPSIASLVLIWQSAGMLHKGRESVSTQVRIRGINAKIRGGEVQHTGVVPFLKSLNRLSGAVHKMEFEVFQRLSTSQSGTKKSKTSWS